MKGRLDVARQKLVDELVSFSMVKGTAFPRNNLHFGFIHQWKFWFEVIGGLEVKVVVVFDALMSGLPTHKEDFAG